MISTEDVIQIADNFGFVVTDKEVKGIIKDYDFEQEQDPSATWDLVVEKMLYDLNENSVEAKAKKYVLDNNLKEEYESFNEFFDDKSYSYFLELEHEEVFDKLNEE